MPRVQAALIDNLPRSTGTERSQTFSTGPYSENNFLTAFFLKDIGTLPTKMRRSSRGLSGGASVGAGGGVGGLAAWKGVPENKPELGAPSRLERSDIFIR